ncbi:MAG TPA: AI-2E family transporter [Mycobacteriales bacterium]|nr:AI-2E family transporter [Mycobacteriales bacterium]
MSEQRPGRTRVDGTPDSDPPADPTPDRSEAVAARERAVRARERAERASAEAAEATAAAEAAEAAAAEAAEATAVAAEPGRAGDGPRDVPDGDPVVDADVLAEEAGVDEEYPLGRPGRPMNRRSPFRIGFAGALGAGFAYLLYQALVSARSVLVLVIVAAFLAIGLNPIVSRLERAGMRRSAAVAIVFVGLLGFFTLFGYAVLPPVINQVSNFVDAVPHYVKDLQGNGTIRDLDRRFGVIDKLNQYVTTGEFGTRIAGNVVSVTQQVAGFVLKALTILILTLYFLSSFNAIKRTAYRLVPRTRRARFSLISDEVLSRVGGYVAGAVVVALIAGVASLIWVSSLGIPYPLALALIVTLTDVIPLIGATIGAVIVTVVAFFVSLPVGIATGIFFLVYQQVENYLIYPRVMSRSVDVNPAAAIVGALIGGTLLGFVGALLAVPATAAIQLILREVLVPRQDAQ